MDRNSYNFWRWVLAPSKIYKMLQKRTKEERRLKEMKQTGQIALYGIKGQPYSQKQIDVVVDAVNKLIVRVEDLCATRPVTQINTCFGYTMSEIHQIIDFAKSRDFKPKNKKNLTKPKK